jgi:predicted GNAT family acetyltransferase
LGQLRRATEADRELLINWFRKFGFEALGDSDPRTDERRVDGFLNNNRGIYLWHAQQAVSMAGYNRSTPNGICISAVYTPPQHRRKGYASACVAALSQLLLDRGRKYCFLFTDLSNLTSNHIYQAIGYRAVCDMQEKYFR